MPPEGAGNLPSAFQINSFLDLRQRLASNAATKRSSINCPKHNDPLKVYCDTCRQVICRDCTISTEHKMHKFELISEKYSIQCKNVQDNLSIVKKKMVSLDKAVTNLNIRGQEVIEQGVQIQEQINKHAQFMIDQVETSRERLSQQLHNIVKQKTRSLAAQKQQAQRLHTQLNTCQEMIDHSLKELTEIQLLTEKQTLINNINTASENVDSAVFQPIEKANIKFSKSDASIEDIGLVMSVMYNKDELKVLPCLAKKPSTATLTLQSEDGLPVSLPPSLISSTLTSHGDTHSVECDITQTHQAGKYNITFTPSTRQDQLIVQVGGVDIPDSPFTLPVLPTPEMRGEPINIITGLNSPCGIAVCDNGDIVVAECGAHCITTLNKEGKKVKSFGTEGTKEGQFTRPRGVTIADGHILVTDDHRLQKLTTDGVCVKSVGTNDFGNSPTQFNSPTGITVHPTTGQIFVADYDNNRVQVFNNNLSHLRSITLKGNKQFQQPRDVALDNEGCLYVTDSFNHCITKLTPKGQYSRRLGSDKLGPGHLYHPTSLAISDDLVYVSYGNNRVSVFDTNGTFLHCFGKTGSREGEFDKPYGMAMDDSLGNLYVSDMNNNRIVVL